MAGFYIRTAEHRAKMSASLMGVGRGVPKSAEHRAKIAASNTGKKKGPLSAAHKAAISARHSGKKISPDVLARMVEARRGLPVSAETRAKIAATLKGRPGRPHSDETKAKIRVAKSGSTMPPVSDLTRARLSAANKRRYNSPEYLAAKAAGLLLPRACSPEARAKMSMAGKGRPKSFEHRAKIGAAHIGKKLSKDHVAGMRARMKAAWASGKYAVNAARRYTTLAKALHSHLAEHGLVLEPEVRFGRYTVDLYDMAHHAAYEADGAYWHDRTERRYPGYRATRDAYLRDVFGLTVTHFSDTDIKRLTGWPHGRHRIAA